MSVSEETIERSLGRIEGQLESLNDKFDLQERRSNDHSKRIRHLENRQHWYAGAAAALGAGVVAATNWFRP